MLRKSDQSNSLLQFHSDIRSEKISKLKNNNSASMLFYDKKEKIQVRIKVECIINYNNEITKIDEEDAQQGSFSYEKDELYDQALDIVKQTKQASISMIQRRLKIGYNRAANIIEMMEREGIVGEQESAGKPRKVYL